MHFAFLLSQRSCLMRLCHPKLRVCKITVIYWQRPWLYYYIISVYNTCTLLLNNKQNNVDANLDASDNVISGMIPHQRCLQAKVKNRNEPKQVIPKSEDLSRSLEKN